MKPNKPLLFCGLLTGLTSILHAQPVSYTFSDTYGKKQIIFESKAPVEYMEGIAQGITGTVVIDTSKSNLGLQATVGVPVDRMQTGNDVRDEHMRSDTWLNAARYPGIRFELTPGESAVTQKGDGTWVVKAAGSFTMKGITKQVTVPLTLKVSGKQVFINGRFSLHLEDYGVNGPIGIKMIGVKISPDVQVVLNLVGSEDPGWDRIPKKK